jgi:hypothetical protein
VASGRERLGLPQRDGARRGRRRGRERGDGPARQRRVRIRVPSVRPRVKRGGDAARRMPHADVADRLIFVMKTKNGRSRTIPLTARARDTPPPAAGRTRRRVDLRHGAYWQEASPDAGLLRAGGQGIQDRRLPLPRPPAHLRDEAPRGERARVRHRRPSGPLDYAGRDQKYQGHARLRARRPAKIEGRCRQLGGGKAPDSRYANSTPSGEGSLSREAKAGPFGPLRVAELKREMAERVGFEPTVAFRPLRFSSPLRPLRLNAKT